MSSSRYIGGVCGYYFRVRVVAGAAAVMTGAEAAPTPTLMS